MKGYDVDGVLANFGESLYEHFGEPYVAPTIWNDPFILKNFHLIKNDPAFWLKIKPFAELNTIGDIYITHRMVDVSVTIQWLHIVGCPKALTLSVENGDKVTPALKYKVEYFLDDKPQNVEELRQAGIKAYLLDRPWNQDADLPRVKSIAEFERITV